METSSVPARASARAGISLRGLSKTYPGTRALSGVDLDFRPGEVHALLGANGSGKSTLIKVLAGCERPDEGSSVTVNGSALELDSSTASMRAGFRFVHQDLALVESMSVADNVLLTSGWPTRARTIRQSAARAEVRAALARLGHDLDVDALVGDLPAALRTVVAVTRAVGCESEEPITLLALDEPTATLPQHEVATLIALVRQVAAQGAAVVIVSHHLQEVLELADVITVLRDGRKVVTATGASCTRDGLIEAMMGAAPEPRLGDFDIGDPADEVVLRCDGLVAPSLADVSLAVRRGEVVGIAGLDGSGRDELLPTIFGASDRLAGTVDACATAVPSGDPRAAMAAGLAYLPADRARAAAVMEMTARENLTLAGLGDVSRRGRLDRRRERREAEEWLERIDVRPANASERLLSAFSGGNQQKIMLARWLRRAPSVFLLNEPTQGVDVSAQARLHSALLEAAASGAGVLVSSSDEEELARICHRVLVLQRGRIAVELQRDELTPAAISAAAMTAEPAETRTLEESGQR